ncbi:hypothetical protein CUMW_162440 [Citrus unshiu]|nr:hypothetical protein CUMW_162440 [Citrus unshiu]
MQQNSTHLDETKVLDERCYEWLVESKWERWALHCMPAWAKCTHVTNKIGKKFYLWMHKYFAQSITRRMKAIVRKTRHLFERSWQLSGIPCAHASKCILNVGREVDDFVDPLLIKDRYLSTYALMMQLLPEEKCWPNSKICLKKEKFLLPQACFAARILRVAQRTIADPFDI